jgi:CheY-like chemotaxis protein
VQSSYWSISTSVSGPSRRSAKPTAANDEFLATLAHELRNPIGPIRNAIEILRLSSDDPTAVTEVREVLARQVKQLSHIVEDLIDVSRIVEKKIELHPQRIAVSSVVDTAVDTCRSLIEACSHRLNVSLPTEPIYVDADPVRVTQVVINLLNNAAKFTEAGGNIWLSAERIGGGRDEVAIRVRDSGIGIPQDLLPRIFDMFTQGEPTTDRARGGLGLGLTLARSRIQMHGGTIEAHSPGPGKGSEFVVRLPAASGDRSQTPDPPEGVDTGPSDPPRKVSKRVLVIDDNHDQVQSLGRLLRLMGHEVSAASDGPGGVKAAIEFLPDVALLDIGLPGINGYEVACRIREQDAFRHALLIAQTGWGQAEDRRRSEEAGFDYHLVKPIDPTVLEKLFESPSEERGE